MDITQKKVGVPYSTSRVWEKAMKKKTQKKRRQEGKRQTKSNDHH